MVKLAAIERLPAPDAGLHAWALDFPADAKEPRITERGLYLQGWVLEQEGVARGQLLLRANGEVRQIPFNNTRPDVIQRVLGVAPEAHAQQRCGFISWVADVPADFELGVMLDDATHWLWRVRLGSEAVAAVRTAPLQQMQVILGTDGWLFLDNDTNRSVDQYTGQLTLEAEGIDRWRSYLDECAVIAGGVNARHAIMIAASKEQVLPEHYPHKKGALTVHEQVLGLCQPRHHVLDTAALLAARPDKEACFIKTDTHWTDRGAMAAVLALLAELGLDAAEARCALAADVYYTMPFAGDLGVKLAPAVMAPTEFLQAPPPAHGAAFDNNLPNVGRVLVFESAEAVWRKSLLMFGASSSYPMLKYLKRLFGRIVFVHGAGNVDPAIVRHEQPDFLVMQTTARFMIEPPSAGFDLREAVASKVAKARPTGITQSRLAASGEQHSKNILYFEMVGSA